jgi:hypothetical protein
MITELEVVQAFLFGISLPNLYVYHGATVKLWITADPEYVRLQIADPIDGLITHD